MEASTAHRVFCEDEEMGYKVSSGNCWPYVKNYAPNPTFDYGGRAAALWLDR